jgi:hypothetical protein
MKIRNWDFLVEHGHFLNFGGPRSFLKFWWSTVICHILVEHGHLSYFWWSKVNCHVLVEPGHKNLRKQIKIKIG